MYLPLVSILSLCFLSNGILAMDICGLEDQEFCHPKDKHCLIERVEPLVRKWFIKGRPEYFIASLEEYQVPELSLPVNGKQYKLINTKISGFENAKLTHWDLDLKTGLFDYDYAYKLNVTVEKFLKENGESVIGNEPLHARIDHSHATTKARVIVVHRCDGNTYMHFVNRTVAISDHKDGDVTFDRELDVDNLKEATEGFIKTVTYAAAKALAKNWTSFTRSIPISAYFKM